MDGIEIFKLIGSSFGYIVSGVAVVTMIVKYVRGKAGGFVRGEAESEKIEQRLGSIEKMLKAQGEADSEFRSNALDLLKKQGHASKQSLAFIIESTYDAKKSVKQLTPLEFKRIASAYSVYHDELKGNSYITEIYTEMVENWEHI